MRRKYSTIQVRENRQMIRNLPRFRIGKTADEPLPRPTINAVEAQYRAARRKGPMGCRARECTGKRGAYRSYPEPVVKVPEYDRGGRGFSNQIYKRFGLASAFADTKAQMRRDDTQWPARRFD